MRMLWFAMFLALLGIFAVVGWQFYQKSRHDAFLHEVSVFQSQTAEWDREKVYAPGESISAKWTFTPIQWDTDVTMEATFLFMNTGTGQKFLSGQFRSLPFFNELQLQVSKPIGYNNQRQLTSSYSIPPQVPSGDYKIIICQRFEHDGSRTNYACYNGPNFKVEKTSEGS